VEIGVFVQAPYDSFVTADTRFWNASGVDMQIGANGLKVDTESLSSILVGAGLWLARFRPQAEPAADQARFQLFADRDMALAPPHGQAQYLRLRFDQAMRGLSVGAPVEFKGVEFGRVTSIQLDYDAARQTFPVVVDAVIYPQRLGPVHRKMLAVFKHTEGDMDGARELIGTFVEHGLRAQARSGNLITGQMFISLDFYPDAPKVAFDMAANPIIIPRCRVAWSSCRSSCSGWSALPSCRWKASPATWTAALRELRASLKQFNGQTLPEVKVALDEVHKTLRTANSAISEDSPQRERMGETLDELERMSRSLRDLADYLGRTPSR
jgi:paraquat-inducible protein B